MRPNVATQPRAIRTDGAVRRRAAVRRPSPRVTDAARPFSRSAKTKIYLGEMGTGATRDAVVDAFNGGSSLMSYVGHGGILAAQEIYARHGRWTP